jgi:hypothetical protein
VSVFVAETYAARACRERMSSIAAAADGAGSARYLRSIFVPEDEIYFHFFEAQSVEAVWEASRRASIAPIRVVEVLGVPSPSFS